MPERRVMYTPQFMGGIEVDTVNPATPSGTITFPGAITVTGAINASGGTGTSALTGSSLTITNAQTGLASSVFANDTGVTLTFAGTVTGTATSMYATRGVATIAAGTTIKEAFVAGVRAGVTVAGTVDQTSATRVAALFAKLDVSSATLTAGQISVIWADWGSTASTPNSAECNVLRVTNTTAAVINSLAYFYGKSTYLFDINSNSATWVAAAGTGGTSAGASGGAAADKVLKVSIDGVAYYIPLYASNA